MVGIDGSTSSLDALTWAVNEAQLRNLPLRLVHAVDYGSFMMGFNPAATEDFFKYVEAAGQKFLDEARAHVQATALEVEVSLHNVTGRPAQLLEEQSKGALLTVVGSSGLNGFTGLLAGSVAVSLTAHGHSPVVVVRSPTAPAGGPVVVGVSGAPDSEDAIGWAFEEASQRGAELLAVLVSSYMPAYFDYIEPMWEDLPGPAREDQQEMLLAERLAGWQEKFPEVVVRRAVVKGHPGHVLLEYTQRAQLMVTGTHGHGNAAGLFLGSTSHRLIQHAACPVLVARPHARESAR
ncbi:universal stress protein [Mycobacterium sp. CBMA293]|nr:universal stress protein [Mycolicibacterium sp. CBMA 360]MUL62215.1 universal stress protein [Mycolicibacterium sp. CBMA 335]MUL71676.1 universal stress protein [Mycolicibacterium sp. CBMA 311]MUL93631.1 universal stress protein [Mycolicibacterium sp. CBMA 230]MUM10517.1 universal stress protein [Mycolicibacterium sp. CBMA 293]MUM32109.1 universal stress protein [Mycolicibacterium sp. CBMA 361]